MPAKPLTLTQTPKAGKMPIDISKAPPMAGLFANSYGYKVCLNKKIANENENAVNTTLFQQLMADNQEVEKQKERSNKKKPYAQVSDEKARMMYGRELVKKLEKANLKRRERSEFDMKE